MKLKGRLEKAFSVCQKELQRTTHIGRKMFSASQTTGKLHECYEELGRIVFKEVQAGRLDWDHPRVREIIKTVESCESKLNSIEQEVVELKQSTTETNPPQN